MDERYQIIELNNGFIKIVNKDTGEIETIERHDLERNVLISKSSLEAARAFYERNESRKRDPRGSFYIVDMENNKELVLSMTDRALLVLLSQFTDYDNVLCKNSVPLTTKEITELWLVYDRQGKKSAIQQSRISERLSRLVKKGVLIALPDKIDRRKRNYRFSKRYLLQGTKDTKTSFVKVYQKHLKETIKGINKIEKNINRNKIGTSKTDLTKVIGLLHCIMPYVHNETSYLVKNPDVDLGIKEGETVEDAIARNPGVLKRLPMSWISRSLGYKSMNRKLLKKHLKVLADAGAIKIDDTNGVTMYLVHPNLMYRKDEIGKHLKNLVGIFTLHKENKSKKSSPKDNGLSSRTKTDK